MPLSYLGALFYRQGQTEKMFDYRIEIYMKQLEDFFKR